MINAATSELRVRLRAKLAEMREGDLCEAAPEERDGYREAVRELQAWLDEESDPPALRSSSHA